MNIEIDTNILREAGYEEAMYGLSLNKNQHPDNMHNVALKLCDLDGGHNKFLEHIYIWLDVRAPRGWWQEADTYRLSSKNSESTMYNTNKKEKTFLTPDNFECRFIDMITLNKLNIYLNDGDFISYKRTLPEGYMQRRMWVMSYKTLRNVVSQRKHHRLPHWKKFIRDIFSNIEHPDLLGVGIKDEL